MKIAIVNDQKKLVEGLAEILTSIPYFHIIWIAQNGKDAIEKCTQKVPDLILMDIDMPVLDGVEATKEIMKENPCAILIVTSLQESHPSKVFQAMGYGALDIISLNSERLSNDPKGKEEFLKKIEMIGRLIGKNEKKGFRSSETPLLKKIPMQFEKPPLLIIGASTGGPAALIKILNAFPKKLNFTTIIIQHVDAKFAPGFVQWLAKETDLPVQIAKSGPVPQHGIFVAGQKSHLVMTENCELKYSEKPENTPFKPSVDVFFHSVAQHWPLKSVAMLLTGMGSDGALGLKALKETGWYTIAEHKKSCVVYGMPKAAVEIDAAVAILEVSDIVKSIIPYLSKIHR